jgi:hypothetical protein
MKLFFLFVSNFPRLFTSVFCANFCTNFCTDAPEAFQKWCKKDEFAPISLPYFTKFTQILPNVQGKKGGFGK